MGTILMSFLEDINNSSARQYWRFRISHLPLKNLANIWQMHFNAMFIFVGRQVHESKLPRLLELASGFGKSEMIGAVT